MVQRTMVTETCDVCAAAGRDDVKAEEFSIAGVVIGACAKCRKALRPTADLLEVYGRAAGAAAVNGQVRRRRVLPSQTERSGRRVRCGSCSQDVAFGSRSWHAKQHHQAKPSEIDWTAI